MDRKSSSQVRQRKANKQNAEQKQEPILNFEETHISVYDEQQFAGELLAKQFIDHLIDEGAKVLYDHYLQSKVAQHTTDTMFTLIDDIIRLQFRKQDNRFNDHSELKEEKIPKNHYDAHSAYAINIDKKLINLEDEQVDDLIQQPTSPYRTQKTFNSTRSKLRPMSSTITEELGKTKRKKPENDLIPIPEPEKTLEDQLLLNEEQKMRTIYNLQLKELQKKKEQEKLRQEEEKKIEEFKKKARKDLDGKSYTYDYNGQPIFFNKKKQIDQQPLVCTVPFQIKSSKNKDSKDEIIEADTSKLTQEQKDDLEKIKSIAKSGNSNHVEKARRKQSSNSQVSNLDSSINRRRSSIDSKWRMEEALKKKILNIPIEEGQEVPAKQRTLKQNVQPAPPKQAKKEEIPDEVYNNGNMRQTSMIPYMTIRDGVKLTEYQNGNEVTKLPDEKPSTDQDENKKKQMTRNEYFKLIEDSRFQEPQFRQQQMSNSRGTFTQRGDLNSRENITQQEDIKSFEREEKEFKKQRVASMLIDENQNVNDLDEETQKENSVYQASVNGYKADHLVIKDTQVKRKRISSQVDANTQYKYNNINPNYFKNYVPNPSFNNNKQETKNQNKTKENNVDGRYKRSITHDNPTQQQVQQKSQLENSKEQQKADTQGIVLPQIPAFQKKKQAILQDIFNQEQKRVSSSKQRQRVKNNSLTGGNAVNNGIDMNNSNNNNKLNITHIDHFAQSKTKINNTAAAPKYLNNQKYLNKSVDICAGQKKHSTTLVEQNLREKQAALLEKNRNIITFGKKEELVQLLINE
ncbi:hypothetical protein TTHERM_00847020 (macronuclear) [Tetrahymena thermophila SB210]|uniref:Uncharacterized protein n=1 Tax=Tetrahymena thermophila (strain SB210) TaxID=312017 RepID=Q22US8_TETTS|nr:hypothetical protein TTHERM_00847020 [Tetrahymena thermophila SB210]EAR89048.2 hypothetical protein TTHERM_00847020 [Tetrahymena thermophila SB210]|eukprot:XP_001009293.2 hypothetical protein TTHERM_00847020 [Tetrahymena thermophila SB210]